MFFPVQNKTVGGSMRVESQSGIGLPENAGFTKYRIAFSVVIVQGSTNSLALWSGLGLTEPTDLKLHEAQLRTEANLELLSETFADAKRSQARAVAVMPQADMSTQGSKISHWPAPRPFPVSSLWSKALAEESANFTGPVYLVNGDSHQFNEDVPLAAELPWLDIHGIDPVPNLQRVTAEGAATSREWLRVSVAPNSAQGVDVLSWERVPFSE
jgi:hypothetical protein